VLQREVVVNSENGLHLRPGSLIARVASQFQCEVIIRNGQKTADARSPLDLMSLNAQSGSRLILEADGPDASIAIGELTALFESDFKIDDAD
jgi:phosphocarrier protein HPr